MRALHPFQQRPGVVQAHSDARMPLKHLDERQIRLGVAAFEHILEVSHRLVRVNEKYELKFWHLRTSRSPNSITRLVLNCTAAAMQTIDGRHRQMHSSGGVCL